MFSSFSVAALLVQLEKAIDDRRHGNVVDPFEAHKIIAGLYSWRDVARRTEKVYNTVCQIPEPDLANRLQRSDNLYVTGQKCSSYTG